MKETVMYAKYNQMGNKEVYNILSAMSNEEREIDRGNYFGSLSGLLRHIMGATTFFLGMYKGAVADGAAQKAISALDDVSFPVEGELSETQWKELGSALEVIDSSYINMAQALTKEDFSRPVKIDWYGGNPESVPLSFMLSQLVLHNTHHRGQISQILDALKIDNDYSGIEIELL